MKDLITIAPTLDPQYILFDCEIAKTSIFFRISLVIREDCTKGKLMVGEIFGLILADITATKIPEDRRNS